MKPSPSPTSAQPVFRIALIDIGNTRTKFAVQTLTQAEFLAAQKAAARKRPSSFALPALEVDSFPTEDWSDEHLAQLKKLAPEGAIVSCVVPEVQEILKRRWKRAHFLSHDHSTLQFDYPAPASIGADRLANAIAARALFSGPVVVISAGTAVTFEVLDAKSRFIGGAISPGYHLMRDALSLAGAQLPALPPLPAALPPAPAKKGKKVAPPQAAPEEKFVSEFLGRDTISSMQIGTLVPWKTGLCVLAQQLRALAASTVTPTKIVAKKGAKKSAPQEEAPLFSPLILTGGDAALLQPLLGNGDEDDSTVIHVEHLALHGLSHLIPHFFTL